MATKKPSAAQLAARKLFAARAKAGTLKKGSRLKANPARKKNPVSPAKVKKVARAINPIRNTSRPASGFAVHIADARGTPAKLIGSFPLKPDAVQYAQAYATAHNRPVVIVGKGV